MICARVDSPLSSDNPMSHKMHRRKSQMNIFRCLRIHFLNKKMTTTIVPTSADLERVKVIAMIRIAKIVS